VKKINNKKPLLPDLYILGVQKAGTTSLHAWLSQHPEIYSNDYIKDVDFFAHPDRSSDPAKYLSEFVSDYKNEKIFLQTHVNYIFYEKALKRISEVHKNHPKFILVLRNPLDRAVSAYHYFVKVSRETRSPKEALVYRPEERHEFSLDNNDLTYIEHGFYFKQLQAFEKYFSLNDLLILDFKQLVASPQQVLEKIYKFIGVAPGFEPSLNIKNKTGATKFVGLQRFLYGSSGLKRMLVRAISTFYDEQKRKLIKQKISEMNTSEHHEKEEIDNKVIAYLNQVFAEDIKKLKQTYKIGFIDDWMQT